MWMGRGPPNLIDRPMFKPEGLEPQEAALLEQRDVDGAGAPNLSDRLMSKPGGLNLKEPRCWSSVMWVERGPQT